MRIIHLISSSGFYGAENVILQLAIQQKILNYSPIIITFFNKQNPNDELTRECQNENIELITLKCNGKIDVLAILALRKILKTINPKIVHSHGYKSNIYSFFSSLGLKHALVSTCHNWIYLNFKMKLYAKLDRVCLSQFDRIVAVSEEVRAKLMKSGIKEAKIKKINNGINIEKFAVSKEVSDIKKKYGIKSKDKVVGTIGRISQEKGQTYLLKAARKLYNEYRNLKILVIGDGPYKKSIEKKFSEKYIIFTGYQENVAKFYSLMDIFVLPSITEGLPMVVLESMAAGKPVVATRVGEIPNIIDDNQTGLIVETKSTKSLKKALKFLIDNEAKAIQMGTKGSIKVKLYFSSESMCQSYLKLYFEVIKERAANLSIK